MPSGTGPADRAFPSARAAIVYLLIAVAVGAPLYVAGALGLRALGLVPDGGPVVLPFFQIALLLVTVWHLRDRRFPWRDAFPVRRPSLAELGHGLATGFAGVLVVIFGLGGLANLVPPDFPWGRGPPDLPSAGFPYLVLILTGVGVAPVAEEVFFRGLVLRGLVARHASGRALLISAVIFGLAHIESLHRGLAAAGLGMLLGWWFLRTRNLVVPVILHAGINAFVTIVLGRVVSEEAWAGGELGSEGALPAPVALLGLAGGVAMLAATLRLATRALPEPPPWPEPPGTVGEGE